jgi:hypothetical protein
VSFGDSAAGGGGGAGNGAGGGSGGTDCQAAGGGGGANWTGPTARRVHYFPNTSGNGLAGSIIVTFHP